MCMDACIASAVIESWWVASVRNASARSCEALRTAVPGVECTPCKWRDHACTLPYAMPRLGRPSEVRSSCADLLASTPSGSSADAQQIEAQTTTGNLAPVIAFGVNVLMSLIEHCGRVRATGWAYH